MTDFLDKNIPKWRGLSLFSLVFGAYQGVKYDWATGIQAFVFIICVSCFFEWINSKTKQLFLRIIITIGFWGALAYSVAIFLPVRHIEAVYFIAIVPSVIIIGADIYETIKLRKRGK